MRITIPTTGSRGDVQPYVALGVGLQARGHQVCVATHADFKDVVRSHGLTFESLELGSQLLQATDTGDRMLHAGGNPFAFMSEFTRLRRPLLHDLLRNCRRACRGADVILSTSSEFLLAESIAEREHLPVSIGQEVGHFVGRWLARPMLVDLGERVGGEAVDRCRGRRLVHVLASHFGVW